MEIKHEKAPTALMDIPTLVHMSRMGDSLPRSIHADHRRVDRAPVRKPSVPGQLVRKRDPDSRPQATNNDNPRPFKRPCSNPHSSNNQLCQECAAIRWNIIDKWMEFEGRFTWVGMSIADVGKRYRNVSPSTTCPLCRQLWAPWIEPYIRQQHPGKPDKGDRIHIFRHLRHLPQVNDYPTSVQQMRKHQAPFHIAVVPILRGWRDELREHFATRGMVVVVPPGQLDSELFTPREVSRKFDPQVVRSWLRCCRRHKTLCKPQAPGVKGLRLIDCNSHDLVIKNHSPEDGYVALSYVWGKPDPSTAQGTKAQTNRSEQTKRGPCRPINAAMCNGRRTVDQRGGSKQVPASHHRSSTAGGRAHPVDTRPRLPRDLPLTIRDAIRVTKALGSRFLWIDKYCIDQSNEGEKQEQFSRMGDIYGGAQLTLFALGRDATYGLPGVSCRTRHWKQQSTSVPPYQMLSTMPDPHFCIERSQWSNRGWTYQEGLFSTRRLFFTDFQIYYECNAMNATESLKSNLEILHTLDGQRLRAYHRAGRFVCGNSNTYSHLKVMASQANHRKIDILRRCQFQVRQYTKRELTYKDDVLNAFAGIARYYAKTTAKIASLAGLPVPFPLAKLPDMTQEGLDHLSYALAWTHGFGNFARDEWSSDRNRARSMHRSLRWHPVGNPRPQRREGFPSWSWAGWFGEIGFRDGSVEDADWLLRSGPYRQFMIRKLLAAQELHLDAFTLSPERIKWWDKDPEMPLRYVQCSSLHVSLSTGTSSLEELRQKLVTRQFECLILGTYGKPRKDVMRAIRGADRKSSKARLRRIDLLDQLDADGLICLIVRGRGDGKWERIGQLKVDLGDYDRERALEAWTSRVKRRFVLA
ncbi:hypothetical protein HJFPF1_10993 [Paramyrothecium foliicola]|nr:hypothetical protein HJFPF1_10993 [Paramyrothecium foliicola]